MSNDKIMFLGLAFVSLSQLLNKLMKEEHAGGCLRFLEAELDAKKFLNIEVTGYNLL
jgi:hypothetical protein